MGSRNDLSFRACTTACLASEILVSMGPSPHLWFFHSKQPLLDQTYKSRSVQTSPVVLCMQNSMINTRINSLYGFQPSSVVVCIQNSDLMTTIARVYGSQTSPVFFCIQNSVPSIRFTSLYVSQPSSVVFAYKTATFGSE